MEQMDRTASRGQRGPKARPESMEQMDRTVQTGRTASRVPQVQRGPKATQEKMGLMGRFPVR